MTAGARSTRGIWRRPEPLAVGSARGEASALPAWPFVTVYAAYIVWWLTGPGDMMWPIFAAIMSLLMLGRRGIRYPRGTMIWLFFLVWVVASMTMLDSGGRILGAIYRLTLLIAPAVFGVYVFNAREQLPVKTITGTFTAFLASTTLGGYIAMAWPTLSFKTLLFYLIPAGLRSNDFISELVVRRTTQWDQTSWIQTDARPSAPFVYSNTWGNIYSLLLPIALVHLLILWREKSKWRIPVALLCIVSVVPAGATQNRGMYVGLILVASWVELQRLRAGHWKSVVSTSIGAGAVAVAWFFSPAADSLLSRLAASSSTDDRFINYLETVTQLQQSPLLGFGAPRPSTSAWLPSLGTQGQFWTVLFSHGLVGIVLFVGFFMWMVPRMWNATDHYGAVLGGIIVATLVEQFYYGMSTGLMVSVVAAALLDRHHEEAPVLGEVVPPIGRSRPPSISRWGRR
ncbi:O-antigen ligase family protein [Schaalia vaccimaxillae]|uniref:O-antigen ligase family protein n=1 Tax=Schaalia vaccimaxillae TaxID=183916 RepID=UPI0003B3E78D|nr:ligase [Schaalia vaccimaxillae]